MDGNEVKPADVPTTRLVLCRRVGERILLDNGVEVEVVQVDGLKVRLMTSAPQNVRIFREEIAPDELVAHFQKERERVRRKVVA